MQLLENVTEGGQKPYFQILQNKRLTKFRNESINFMQHESLNKIRELFIVSEYWKEKLTLTIKEAVLKDFEEDTLDKLLKVKLGKALMRRMQWLSLQS